jgi:hypothetical protein
LTISSALVLAALTLLLLILKQRVSQPRGRRAIASLRLSESGRPRTVRQPAHTHTGNVIWQQSYDSFTGSGSPTASNNALSIIQASDGGYRFAGNWVNAPSPGECCSAALVLKLGSAGDIQWQNALSGGLYCLFNGFSEARANLTAVAYTAHQTADGSYVLTGYETLKLTDETPLEPWIAKVDANGDLLCRHLYYQTNKTSGRPLSEYFASSAATGDAGFFGLGFTENATSGHGELLAVKTDAAGKAGSSCGDEHPATALKAADPAPAATVTSLPCRQPQRPSRAHPRQRPRPQSAPSRIGTAVSSHPGARVDPDFRAADSLYGLRNSQRAVVRARR